MKLHIVVLHVHNWLKVAKMANDFLLDVCVSTQAITLIYNCPDWSDPHELHMDMEWPDIYLLALYIKHLEVLPRYAHPTTEKDGKVCQIYRDIAITGATDEMVKEWFERYQFNEALRKGKREDIS